MELKINSHEVGDVVVVELNGELDSFSCPELRSTIVNLVDQGKCKIVLNLAGVEYIDSAGLGTLVGGLKRTTEHGGLLKLANARSQVEKVLNITGLVRVFQHYDSVEDAIKSFSESQSPA